MNMTIYPIPLGVDKAYIIQGEGVVMIDGNECVSYASQLRLAYIR